MSLNELLTQLNTLGVKLYLDEGKLKSQSAAGVIGPELGAQIKRHKEAIIELLTENNATASNLPIKPFSRNGELPMSYAQERMWVIDKLQGGSPEYNMPLAFKVRGEFDLDTAERAFSEIVRRHEILRTNYIETKDGVHQKVCGDVDFHIERMDMSELSGEVQQQQLLSCVQAFFSKSFDLQNDLMLAVKYIHTSLAEGVLLFNMHLIASDGWSMDILSKEFFSLYNAFLKGQPSPLPELEIQYADYAQWHREHVNEEVLADQLTYWKAHLDGVQLTHSLPLAKPRSKKQVKKGAWHFGSLSADTGKLLKKLAVKHQLTPFMLAHAAFSLVLARHSNQSDVVIGTNIANRNNNSLNNLIGFFVNSLVLRVNTEQESLEQYFSAIKRTHTEAQKYGDVPFEQLVKHLNVPRQREHFPLFQIILNSSGDYGVNDGAGTEISMPGVAFELLQNDFTSAKFDINISISIADHGVNIQWLYDSSILSDSQIHTMNEHLKNVLNWFASSGLQNESAVLSDIPLLLESERNFILDAMTGKSLKNDQDMCVHQLFEQQALKHMEQIAIEFEDSTVTYSELNSMANHVAAHLTKMGIGKDDYVAICMERSCNLIVSILAVLKSGAAYIPLDENNSQHRTCQIIEDAKPSLVLVSEKSMNQLPNSYENLSCDINSLIIKDIGDGEFSGYESSAEDTAYVIYTSGSTGTSKGVVVSHEALMGYLTGAVDSYYQPHLQGSLLLTSHAFDLGIPSLFLPLVSGDILSLLENGEVFTSMSRALQLPECPDYLLRMTPHHAQGLLEVMPENASLAKHSFVVGGEAFSLDIAMALQNRFPNSHIFNHYGPTEGIIGCSFFDVTKHLATLETDVPIGKPLPNTHLFVLDTQMNMLPVGVTGELYIGKTALANGYMNQPDLTSVNFVVNPFSDEFASSIPTLYRTGDLVRLDADGMLHFAGRTDSQVKINGYRVELDEVSRQIEQQPGVDSAEVMKDLEDNQLLLAYVKFDKSELTETVLIKNLQVKLAEVLPKYMQPSQLIHIDEWPLNANGKLDKKSLRKTESQVVIREFKPESDIEKSLAEFWLEITKLQIDNSNVEQDLFDMGGNSLQIIRFMGRIRDAFNVEIDFEQIHENLSIRASSNLLARLMKLDSELHSETSPNEEYDDLVL